MNKISDEIASSVSDEKLMEFGLVYGDIRSYGGMFPTIIVGSQLIGKGQQN